MSLSLPIPKAVLYYHPRSVWCSAVLLCLEEKGYGKDELEMRVVSLGTSPWHLRRVNFESQTEKGENFAPGYLRISSQGTIPALVVPLDKTLAPNIPHRYKALTSTNAILEFLDKSRLITSKTHTTSSAPAPALRPATVSLGDISNRVIETLHSTPINFVTLAAITQEELISKAAGPEREFVGSRHSVLESYLTSPDANVEVIKTLWEARFYENEFVRKVYLAAEKPTSDLEPQQITEREAFFKQSMGAWAEIKRVLGFLETQIISPYTLGDQLSLVDLHLAAWLSRVLHLVKVQHTPSTIVGTDYDGFHTLQDVVRRNTHDPNFVVGSKVKDFCVAIMKRESWRKGYKNGLH